MSTPILIVNINHVNRFEHGIYYVGRKCGGWAGSALGNPFIIGRDGDRDACVEKYRFWLWKQIQNPNSPALRELNTLVKKYQNGEMIVLGCWCGSSKPCHAQVIRRAILYLAKQDQKAQRK